MKCKLCGADNTKYPIIDSNGKIVWMNFLRTDKISMFFLIFIMFMAWAYQHDTAQCYDIVEKPCNYAVRLGCCRITENATYQILNLSGGINDYRNVP